jgi:hypothetical protein
MSTRTRPRPATARPRRPPVRRAIDRRIPVAIALAAEAGHLAGAMFEWPASAPLGVYHTIAAAILGLLAVSVYFGRSVRILVFAIAFPIAWLAGGLLGLSPYAEFPILGAILITLFEVALVGVLVYPIE